MAEFEVILQDKETSARLGKLHINGWHFETPILWLGHNLNGPIYPWRTNDSNVPGVLVNACQILERRNVLERVQTVGIQEFLKYPGPVMMDSGGFRFQSRPEISVSTDEIMSLYQDAGVDIGVILDHPFDPSVSERENGDRWKKTLRNLKSMSGQSNDDFVLMPVVHGYSPNQLRESCKHIMDITGIPEIVGLGSLVPLLKGNYTSSRFGGGRSDYSNIQFVKVATEIVRDVFPESLLHVFGVGGTTTMNALYCLGADSVDSVSWRLKAAYGAIQLQGTSDRFLVEKKWTKARKTLSEAEMTILGKCRCPICSVSEKISGKIRNLKDSFANRAIHNSWIFLKEVEVFKRNLQDGCLSDFVLDRLNTNHKFYNIIQNMVEHDLFEYVDQSNISTL